jgi:hypothetical protein
MARSAERLWFVPADPRVYALARIAFAVAVLWTLIEFWPIRDECFAAGGTLNLNVVRRMNGWQYPSLLYLFESPSAVSLFFAVALLAAVCLAIGFMTRLSALVTYAVMMSYTHRAFAVTTGSDQLLRIFSLLIAISPIHRAFALDEFLHARRGRPATIAVPAYGLVLMRLQVFIIYYQTVWLKSGDAFWRRGDLMSYFLMSMYSRYPGRQWADWETLSAVLTYGTILSELAVPWLLLFRPTRALGFTIGFGMHLTIALLSKLALFSFCMLSTYLAFLERADVDALLAWARSRPDAASRPATAGTTRLS